MEPFSPRCADLPSLPLDTSDPPANIVTDPEEAVALSQIFCGANPFCYTCDELTDMAEKNVMLLTGSLHLVRNLVWDLEFLSVFRPGPSCVATGTIRSGLIRIFLTNGLGFFMHMSSLVFLGTCTN